MGIFNTIGKALFNRTANKPSVMEGSDGVMSVGGWINSGERSPDLDTPRARFTTFANAINDCTMISAAVHYMVELVASSRWTVTAREDAGEQGELAAKIVREGIIEAKTRQPWSDTVGQCAMAPLMGFSMHEWSQRRRKDGLIVLGDIQCLPQWTIARWDRGDKDDGAVRGVEQWSPGLRDKTTVYLNRRKLLYVVDRKITNNPDGIGLLRHVVKKWKTLERLELLEAYGFEGDLRGIPYGRAPYAAIKQYAADNNKSAAWVKEQTAALRTFIENHIKNPGLGLILDSELYTNKDGMLTGSPKWALELMKGDGQGLVEIAAAIERINREIARVLGMEFLLLGGDGKGSLALSRDKTSMFATLLASCLSQIAWAVTYDMAWPLIESNGLDPEMCAPKILPDPIATEDIEKVTRALVDMAQAGAPLMPDDPVVNQIRQRLHLADAPKLSPELLGAMQRAKMGVPFGQDPTDPNHDPNKPNPEDPNGNNDGKPPTDKTPPINSKGPDKEKGEVEVDLDDDEDAKRKAA